MTDAPADYRFDPIDAAVMNDPGPHYAELARRCPFYHQQGASGDYWISSDPREIREDILAPNPYWSFKWGNAAKDTAHDTGIVTDPPFHNAFRNALLPGLSAKRIKLLVPQIEGLANDLVDRMLDQRGGCLHDLFAMPMPAQVMCLMLGAPLANHARYKAWADEIITLMFHDATRGSHKAIFAEIYAHFIAQVNDRRALLTAAGIDEPELHHLGDIVPDDYMARAICCRVNGRRLTDMEIVNICVTFLTGGQETTTSLITNCVWRLLQVPERWDALKANPELITIAVEESLRFDPPVLAHFRTSLGPVEMHGEHLPDHAKLMFSIAGVNRDPKTFDRPDEFRLDRPINEARKHIAFGSGIHFCIGAPLARLEAEIALRVLLERLPKLRLLGDGERITTWMYWGRHSLPVAWN